MGSYQRINQGAYGSERQACNHDKACLWRVWNSDRVTISRVAMGLSVARDVVRRLGCGFDALRKATDCMTGREHVAHVFIVILASAKNLIILRF